MPGDHHEFVVRQYLSQGDDRPGLLGALQCDDALTAAPLHAIVGDLGSLAHAFLAHDQQRRVATKNDHADYAIVPLQLNTSHAAGRAAHLAHVLLIEANAHPVLSRQHDVIGAIGDQNVDEFIALFDVDCVDARRTRVPVRREHCLLHDPVPGGEHQVFRIGKPANCLKPCDPLIGTKPDQVHYRTPSRRSSRLWDVIDLEPIHTTVRCKEQDVVVRRGDKEVFHPVVFLGAHAVKAPPATPLPAVGGYGNTLDIARARNGDHHILFGNEILHGEVALVSNNFSTAVITELLHHLPELFLENRHALRL